MMDDDKNLEDAPVLGVTYSIKSWPSKPIPPGLHEDVTLRVVDVKYDDYLPAGKNVRVELEFVENIPRTEIPEDLDAMVGLAKEMDNATMRPFWVLRTAMAILPQNFREGAMLLAQQRGARTRARNAAKEIAEITKRYAKLMEEL
jgi:hypothetical protein